MKKFSLGTVQRYMAVKFLPVFFLFLFFFLSFLLTTQLFKLIPLFLGKDVELVKIFELLFHIMISFLPGAIPLSCFLSMVFVLNRLSEDSEIIAMRSFGLNRWKLFYPFLILGVFISFAFLGLNKNLAPYSKTLYKNTILSFSSKGFAANIKSRTFFTDIPRFILFAEEVTSDGEVLRDVFIQQKSKGGIESIIMAKYGNLIKEKFSDFQKPTMRLKLRDGNIISVSDDKKEMSKFLYKEYDFPIIKGGGFFKFIAKDSMRTSEELRTEIERLKKEIELKRSKHLTRSLSKAEVEYYSRINGPIQCILFIF